MSTRKIASLLIAGLAIGGIQMLHAAEPKSPEQIHMALRILASVYADMDAKLKEPTIRPPAA